MVASFGAFAAETLGPDSRWVVFAGAVLTIFGTVSAIARLYPSVGRHRIGRPLEGTSVAMLGLGTSLGLYSVFYKTTHWSKGALWAVVGTIVLIVLLLVVLLLVVAHSPNENEGDKKETRHDHEDREERHRGNDDAVETGEYGHGLKLGAGASSSPTFVTTRQRSVERLALVALGLAALVGWRRAIRSARG